MSSTDEPSTDEASSDLQKTFDTFSKIAGNNDGKLSGAAAKQWLLQAGVVGDESHQISENEADKCLPESAIQGDGMDMKEFEQYIADLAKDKGIDANDIKNKLSMAVPSRESLDLKLDEIKKLLTEKIPK